MLINFINKTLTTRELHRNLPKIRKQAAKGQEYTVLHYGKPAFIISPPTPRPDGTFYTFEDLLKLRFKSGERNLSQRIDEIVYDNK